jgi:adenosylhomocysteine nucleosidase
VQLGALALVSFGLAGGLDSALAPGSLLVPGCVVERDTRYAANPALRAWLGPGSDAPLAACAEPVATVVAKARLRAATAAAAVDLESGAVARVAERHNLPFAVLRAVCDPAWRALPEAALVALNRHGEVGFGPVLAWLARRPGQLPSLLALARDAARARAALVRRVGEIRARGGFFVT